MPATAAVAEVRAIMRVTRTTIAALLALGAVAANAQLTPLPDPIKAIAASYETTVSTAFGPLPDHEVVISLAGGPTFGLFELGPLPADAEVDAFAVESASVFYFSLAEWAELPGGVRAHPGDVVGWNGTAYFKVFDVMACLGASELNVDAVDIFPGLFGAVVALSFDTTRFMPTGGGFVLFDEQLVTAAPYGCILGTAPVALPVADRGLDLDAVSMAPRWSFFLDQQWYVSFDSWGEVGGFALGPSTIVDYRPFTGQWASPVYGLGFGPLPEGDIDALWVWQSGLFADDFESGSTSRWSATSS
jgi:hypothetical protein